MFSISLLTISVVRIRKLIYFQYTVHVIHIFHHCSGVPPAINEKDNNISGEYFNIAC